LQPAPKKLYRLLHCNARDEGVADAKGIEVIGKIQSLRD
jgi:hypothetical protein